MPQNVMIVDDNEYVRASVEMTCEGTGIEVTPAASGPECLRLLTGGFRGLILMDIMMPEMDGWDTIREIIGRGLYPGNIIIMLTGVGEPDAKMEGMQEYVTDYLTKPFAPEQLLETLNYYLKLQQTLVNPHE
ncbi:response regulator [Geomesophilobacter sediminis]|uniref:Response regulator n=1 Tax=Geomesophilobacter sediminis TaxID=2798584 RepID=A0A8J7SCK9_9BACT|nr:response regulator [Geomesophilobacter sediminis]MBJ6727244.1 response regulator [Geomesophilobacter sediminis]